MPKTPDFQTFWNAYGLKRDRIAAERAWSRLSTREKKAAIAGIQPYRDDCLRRGISMKYAQGYLNNHRWEDEITTTTASVSDKMGLSDRQQDGTKTKLDMNALVDMEEW